MMNAIESASLGHVGKITSALVLYVHEEGGAKYYMSPYDIKLYTYINEDMPKLVNCVKKYLRFRILYNTQAIISYFVAVNRLL